MCSSGAALMVRRREKGGSGSKDKDASVPLKCLINPHIFMFTILTLKIKKQNDTIF